MIKAELYDLGPHNGMAEPDPTGSYWAFTVSDLGQPGDEAQALTFLVPAHQLPTDQAQAEKEAAVAAEREACAEIADERTPGRPLLKRATGWRIANAIRARADADPLAAHDARMRAKALRDIKEKAIEIMALEEGETEENLKGYARGSYFAAKCILATLEGKNDDE